MIVENRSEGAAEKSDGQGRRRVVSRVVGKVKRADDSVVELVRERPIATLCAAMIAGYLVGRIFMRIT
jgi:hypothetical protein